MRRLPKTAIAAGLCALTIAAPLAGAEPQRKLDNLGRLDWLELRTMFASTERPVTPGDKANQRASSTLDTASDGKPVASPGFDLFAPELRSAWDLVQQRAQLAAKFTSKRLADPTSADRTAPELSWGWQHES